MALTRPLLELKTRPRFCPVCSSFNGKKPHMDFYIFVTFTTNMCVCVCACVCVCVCVCEREREGGWVNWRISPKSCKKTQLKAVFILESCWTTSGMFEQGILKGEVSLYHWPPVWLVWNSLFCKWKQKLSVIIHLNPNQSNRRSTVQWYFPFSIPWFTGCVCCDNCG